MNKRRRIIKPKDIKKTSGKIIHRKTTVDGITFDSKMESEYYKLLKQLKEQQLIKDFSLQPQFLLQEGYIIVNSQVVYESETNFTKLQRKYKAKKVSAINYIADFMVTHNDNSIEIVDTKGIETADFKIKKKLFMCRYPQYIFNEYIYHNNQWMKFEDYKTELRRVKKERTKNK